VDVVKLEKAKLFKYGFRCVQVSDQPLKWTTAFRVVVWSCTFSYDSWNDSSWQNLRRACTRIANGSCHPIFRKRCNCNGDQGLRSKTLHKHSKPMHTALPQPPSPLFYSFQVLWKSILQIFSPSLKKMFSFFQSFFYLPQDPICFLYLVPIFIYTYPSIFPKRIPLLPCILLPCLLFFSFLTFVTLP
jgi:hypothetical protein